MKKFLAIVLCIAMTLSIVACSDNSQQTIGTATTAAASAEGDAVAVKVGDLEIKVSDIENALSSYLEMYEYYGYSAPTEDADIEALQDQVVEELVAEKLKLYMASQLGCDTLTEEQQDELDQQVAEDEASLLDYYAGEEDESLTDEQKKENAIAAIEEELAANGWDMDYAGYIEYMRDYYKQGYILENLEAYVKNGAEVSDEDIQEYYNNLLDSQKAEFEEDPTAYIDTEMDSERNGGEPAVVVPEGYKRIKVIEFSPETELGNDYTDLQNQMAELEKEYGKNALAADGDKTRMQEIVKEYQDLSKQAEELSEENLTDAKAAVEAAYARLQAGEDFDTVLKDVNPDSEYVTVPKIAEKGSLIMPDQDDGVWSDAVREGIKGLADGKYSGIIKDEDTFYIISMIGDELAGEISLEDVKELIKAAALEVAQDTLWEEKQEEWESDISIVTKFEDLYRGIGK